MSRNGTRAPRTDTMPSTSGAKLRWDNCVTQLRGESLVGPPELSDFDGGSADRARASGLWQPSRQDASYRLAGRRRGGVRFVLLQQPALRAVAVFISIRPPRVRHRRLRQRGGISGSSAHLRALFAARRLPDGAERQDAFLWRGSIAWIRRTADHRHLSRRLRRATEPDSVRASPELVSHHGFSHPGGPLHSYQPNRLRRRRRLLR